MPRRVNLPGADELFGTSQPSPARPVDSEATGTPAAPGPSGRVRHDEKITVYVSSAELLGLEQARLRLRADLGVNVDRGRLVRVAIDMLVDDLAAHGEHSDAIQRLRQ